MTSTNRGLFERRLDDEQAVDQLLAEAGFPEDAGLREVLMQLKALRDPDVPEPSAELLALMGGPETADIIPLPNRNSQHARRTRQKRRVALTSLAVAASLGVAGGAAAGNETIRRGAEETISTIMRSFAPPVPAAPATPSPATPAPAAPTQEPGAGAPSPGAGVVLVPGGETPPAAPAPPAAVQGFPGQGQLPADGQPEAAQHPGAGAPEVPGPGPGAASPMGTPASQDGKAPNPHPTAVPGQNGQPATGNQAQPGAGRPDTKGRPDSSGPDGLRPTKFTPQSGD